MKTFFKAFLHLSLRLARLYLILLIVLFCVQRYLIFIGAIILSPERHEVDYQKWESFQRIFHPREDVDLYGWHVERPGKPLLVFYGGNGRDVSDMIGTLAGLKDFSVLTFNYRGFGKSTGSPSEKVMVSDALLVLDKVLEETGRKASDVVVIGESIGSGVATQVAASREVGNLVLLVPFDSLLSVAKEKVPYMPIGLILKDRFRSDKFAQDVKCPVHILAAAKDEVIPVHHARHLATCFPRPVHYREYQGVGHNNLFSATGSFNDFVRACYLPGQPRKY